MACVNEPTRVGSTDAGVTLVEVLIALTMLAALLASTVPLMLSSITTQTGLQRHQQASIIAQSVLERAQAAKVAPTSAGCVPLLRGRTETLVNAQWASAPAHVDLSHTDKAWASNSCGTDITVPTAGVAEQVADDLTTPAITHSGQDYVVRTWVGTCAMLSDGASCVPASAAPATAPMMYRVITSVEWDHHSCNSTLRCAVTNSITIDPSTDPVFSAVNTHTLTAVSDLYCTTQNTPLLLNVLANDTGSLSTTPVVVTGGPYTGTLTSTLTTGVGGYVPPTGFIGTDSFTYKLVGPSGTESPETTVHIMVQAACS